ncbi:type 1 fimbrial protein [Klebsiella aerogenes]|nr:type 1 fimbrial protein [Klebsiella aerogenes]
MLKFLYATLLLLGLFPLAAQAVCHRTDDTPSQSYVAMPQQLLVSSKNYAPGEILYDSGYMSGGTTTIKNCAGTYYVGFHYAGALTTASPLQDNVYPLTNGSTATGLGIRVYTINQAGPFDDERAIDNSWQEHDAGAGSDHTLNNSAYRVQIIATGGPITSGTFNVPSPLARVDYRETQSIDSSDGDIASTLTLSTTTVQVHAMGCTASVSSLLFDMGSVDVSSFDNQKTVEGPEQSVGLSCEPGTNVTLKFSGAVASGDNDNGSVFALTDAGSDGVATGVGVKILTYNPNRQSFISLPIGQTFGVFSSDRDAAAAANSGQDADGNAISDIGSATTYNDDANRGGAGASEAIRFRADYYKTGSAVTPGTANATGTITLQYN